MSVRPLDREIDGLEEGPLLGAVREDAERVAGDGTVVAGAGDGVAQRAVAVEQSNGALEVVVALFEVFEGAAPEPPLGLVAASEREDDGESDLAVAEIVADALSEFGLLGGIVEHVVDKLEGDAEIEAEALQRLLFHFRPASDHCADAAGGREERRGLATDDVEIGLLAGLRVVAGDEL